jgi:hypothetical protein
MMAIMTMMMSLAKYQVPTKILRVIANNWHILWYLICHSIVSHSINAYSNILDDIRSDLLSDLFVSHSIWPVFWHLPFDSFILLQRSAELRRTRCGFQEVWARWHQTSQNHQKTIENLETLTIFWKQLKTAITGMSHSLPAPRRQLAQLQPFQRRPGPYSWNLEQHSRPRGRSFHGGWSTYTHSQDANV